MTQHELELAAHLCDARNGVRFNTLGLLNTNDKGSMFRVKATIGPYSFAFNQVDWKSTSHKQFCFCHPDTCLEPEQLQVLLPHTSIIYQIDRFAIESLAWEDEYAYVVQPLFQQNKQLIKGQFHLPLFRGKVPPIFGMARQNPIKLIKSLQMIGQAEPILYVQMIARACNVDCNEPAAKDWWPSVEADMTLINIADSRQLMYYVLHAKHSHDRKDAQRFENLYDNFE